ncbi:MAG: hypothetical protein ABIH38_03935 [Patescibacteria group bacterium]
MFGKNKARRETSFAPAGEQAKTKQGAEQVSLHQPSNKERRTCSAKTNKILLL